MAGTIPGVESARRRRFRGSTGWSDSSFTINSAFGSTRNRGFYGTRFTSTSLSQRSMINNNSHQDGKLGGVATKAKQRLDERLRSHWKSEINSQERSRGASLVEEIGREPSSSMVGGRFANGRFWLEKEWIKEVQLGENGVDLEIV